MLFLEEMQDGFSCIKDGALRASSVADSTLMRILHSAMDRAQEKVKSRDGVLERLSERSKFCELAMMQLDGCLRFVEEETQDDFVLESNHEEVLTDLTEIRDRLRGHLEETDVAISKMDREMSERLECEFKLKQALESKEREIAFLRAKLELEKAKNAGGVQGNCNEGRDGEFSILKNSVDQQLWNIKQKLEGERKNISKMGPSPTNSVNLEPDLELLDKGSNEEDIKSKDTDPEDEDEGKEEEKETPTSSLMYEINMGIDQMGLDIDALKETFDHAFGRMHIAIHLSELGPLEKQWRRAIEKDVMCLSVKGLMEELPGGGMGHKRNENQRWTDLVNEIASIHRELESICSENESTISQGKVSQQTNSQDTESLRRRIRHTIVRFGDSIIKWSADFGGTFDDCRLTNEKELMSVHEIEKLKQENQDLSMQSTILEQTYLTVFADLMKGLYIELYEIIDRNQIESQIREEVFCIYLQESDFLNCSKPTNKLSFSETEMVRGSEESLIQKLDFLLQSTEAPEEEFRNERFDVDYSLGEECENEDESSFRSVSSKLEKAMHQLVSSRALLSELESSVDPVGTDLGKLPDHCTEEMKEQLPVMPKENTIVQLGPYDDSTFLPLKEFSQFFIDFEHTIDEEMVANNARMEEMNSKLDQLVGVAASLRKKETAYRKAFLRRCENLQKAETEVDLLGDQVDELLGLLEKIYITLNYYAPVLQQHFGVSDMLKLIEKELTGVAAAPS